MFRNIFFSLFFIIILLPVSSIHAEKKDIESYLTGLPFPAPKIDIPVFPERSFNILDFGAVGDGRVLNTSAFKRAIAACSGAGGGTVIVPQGVWLTGPIELASNLNLRLEKGALIILSKNYKDYPMLKFPGGSKVTAMSPVYGYNLKNVAITGKGIIDGSGETWRPVKKMKTTASQWKSLLSSGGAVSSNGKIWWPSKQAMEGEAFVKNLLKGKKHPSAEDYLPAKDYLRPYMILLINCKNVLFDGPTFENSPKFVMYPYRCENVVIRNLKVLNEWWAQNGDGIDISACKDVLIYNCTLSVGDDGICMKSSGRSPWGDDAALQNIVIADNVVYHAHGGFVIGSNTDGGVKNISVKNCDFIGTDIGLRFKSARGKGGLVHDIYIDNIYMKDIVNQAILFNTYYEVSKQKGEEQKFKVNKKTPRFRKFYIQNIICSGAKNAVEITGLPEMPISEIFLKNITISAHTGFLADHAYDINLDNVRIFPEKGSEYLIRDSRKITLNKVNCPVNTKIFMEIYGKNTSGISVNNSDLSEAATKIKYGKDADKNAVVIR